MHRITAVMHTRNDALRLGRCLETLYPCDEILIVDHDSQDDTLGVAQNYGARVVRARNGASAAQYVGLARAGWILCLDPHESLTEALAASLYEWKSSMPHGNSAFCMFLREETSRGWVQNPEAQTRLVPANWNQWQGSFPTNDAKAAALDGEILHFILP